MRVFMVIVLSVFLAFLITQIWGQNSRIASVRSDLKNAEKNLEQARIEKQKIQNDFEYYSDPVNLEKELRARFNYRAPDEKMIIIVPTSSVPSQTSTE